MTTTQYNSKNSLTPELKWTSLEKRNNLDEFINIPVKERSVIQISFGTQGQKIRQAQSGIRVKNYSWFTIHCVFKLRESARFTAPIHHNRSAFKGQIRRSENLFTPLLLIAKFKVKQCCLIYSMISLDIFIFFYTWELHCQHIPISSFAWSYGHNFQTTRVVSD